MNKNKEFDPKDAPYVKLIWGIVIAVFGIAIIIYILKFGWPLPISSLGTLEQFGSFGDFIGGLMNPLLQFIVIAMLLWSIRVQQFELGETRKAVLQSNTELKQSATANTISANALKLQGEFQRTQLELEVLKQLIEKKYSQVQGLSASKLHIARNNNMNGKDAGKTYLFSQILKITLLHGCNESNLHSYISGRPDINELLAEQGLIINEILELLHKYGHENGSIYFIENWLDITKPYVYILSTYSPNGLNLLKEKYQSILSKINDLYSQRGVDFTPIKKYYSLGE
jgi:hypothetical protein